MSLVSGWRQLLMLIAGYAQEVSSRRKDRRNRTHVDHSLTCCSGKNSFNGPRDKSAATDLCSPQTRCYTTLWIISASENKRQYATIVRLKKKISVFRGQQRKQTSGFLTKLSKIGNCYYTVMVTPWKKQGSCLEEKIVQGTMPGARRRGRPRTAWMDNIKTSTGLPVEKSIRMTEDRDEWRKYVHGVANSRMRTAKEQNRIYAVSMWLRVVPTF